MALEDDLGLANGVLATAATSPEDRRILAQASNNDFSTAISASQLPPAANTFEQRWGPQSNLDWRYELANMDPRERDLLYRSTKAEVGDQSPLQQAKYMESVVNRLHSARTLYDPNTSLSQIIVGSVKGPGGAEIGGTKYYPQKTKRKMAAGALSDEENQFYDQLFGHVTGDRNSWRQPSNYCNYCTGNESADVRSGGAPVVSRGTQRGDYERYVQENWTGPWVRQMQGQAPTGQVAAGTMPDVPAGGAVARAGSSPTVAEGSDGSSQSSLRNASLAAALMPYFQQEQEKKTGGDWQSLISGMQMKPPQMQPVDYRSFFRRRAAAPAQNPVPAQAGMQAGGRIVGAAKRFAPIIEEATEEGTSALARQLKSPPSDTPLAYEMLSTATEDPFERAALRQRESAHPSRGRAYSETQERALQFLVPQTPLDVATYAVMGPTGKLLPAAARWLIPSAKGALLGLGGMFGFGGVDLAQAPENPLGGAVQLPRMQAGGRIIKAAEPVVERLLKYLKPGEQPIVSEPLAGRILETTREHSGMTIDPMTGTMPSSGLMVAKYPNVEPVAAPAIIKGRGTLSLSPETPLTPAYIREFVQANRELLAPENRYLGTWIDPATGKSVLDVSERFDPERLRAATKFGERTGQEAGYNLGTKEQFPIGNWWEFIGGPEYRQRLREMAEEGRGFLAQHPSKEWWDLHDTSLERVYGGENLPFVAGYTAATAPRTKIIPNIRQMTEYMRRQLAGEPVVQPQWRVPQGALSMQPGGLMPMETSRVANLERVRRGELGALSEEKVADEARAFLGDPNVGPIDVHHIRLGEAPERGIFAAAQPGEIESKPTQLMGGVAPYRWQQAQIADEAHNFGRTLRDYSADVWTGITETIRRTGQLYGTPFKKGSIGGGEGYADQFSKMLRSAAEKLGMDQDKLEHELRSGNTSLLSHVLVTSPALAAAYSQWRASLQPSESGPPSSGQSPPSAGGPRTAPGAL